MRVTTWAVVAPLGCCLVLGYACCRGLRDPVTVALYHLFAYWALIGALFAMVCALLDWIAARRDGDMSGDDSRSEMRRRRRRRPAA
jgi:hypothetical protein